MRRLDALVAVVSVLGEHVASLIVRPFLAASTAPEFPRLVLVLTDAVLVPVPGETVPPVAPRVARPLPEASTAADLLLVFLVDPYHLYVLAASGRLGVWDVSEPQVSRALWAGDRRHLGTTAARAPFHR